MLTLVALLLGGLPGPAFTAVPPETDALDVPDETPDVPEPVEGGDAGETEAEEHSPVEESESAGEAADAPAGRVDGVVWVDADGHGVRPDAGNGLGGVEVALLDVGGDESAGTTASDAAGEFAFADVAPGAYTVSAVLPDGYGLAPAAASDDGAVSTFFAVAAEPDEPAAVESEPFTLEAGEDVIVDLALAARDEDEAPSADEADDEPAGDADGDEMDSLEDRGAGEDGDEAATEDDTETRRDTTAEDDTAGVEDDTAGVEDELFSIQSSNPENTRISTMTFYAYVADGESLDVFIERVGGVAGSGTVTVEGPGAGPQTCTFPSTGPLPAGATVTIRYSLTLDGDLADGTRLVNAIAAPNCPPGGSLEDCRTDTTVSGAATSPPSRRLPFTGLSLLALATIALGLLATGGALLTRQRRRAPGPRVSRPGGPAPRAGASRAGRRTRGSRG